MMRYVRLCQKADIPVLSINVRHQARLRTAAALQRGQRIR